MKKAVIAVMAIIMSLTAVFIAGGCTDEAMQAQIDGLVNRIEDLENKNNVFWTDKAEYTETETMTVYFKDTAVYEIRLSFDTTSSGLAFGLASNYVVNGSLYIKSLISDIFVESVIANSYMLWEDGIAFKKTSTNQIVLYKGIEKNVGAVYESSNDIASGTTYDFVICVPGTQFEIARFVNVRVSKGN